MAPVVHRFDPPDRFVAGTVGQPGERAFYLQARSATQLVTVAAEKQQVEILGERVDELLDELSEAGASASPIPATTTPAEIDRAPLEQPIEEDFRAGTITLSWDTEAERVVIEVFALEAAEESTPIEADEESLIELPIAEPEPNELLVVRLLPAQARAFAGRASALVRAGRPTCQFCGGPMDPRGHLCPRANGFRRRGD